MHFDRRRDRIDFDSKSESAPDPLPLLLLPAGPCASLEEEGRGVRTDAKVTRGSTAEGTLRL